MALDRDLNVAVLRAAFAPTSDRTGAELYSATGVRGLRLLAETGAFRRFVLIDRHAAAVAVLSENAAPFAGAGARVVRADSRRPLLRPVFDYLDIDPYGSPLEDLAGAVAVVAPGGLIGITATDLQVLGGVMRGACQRRYGSVPIRGRLAPESGLRILLAAVARIARAGGRAVRPVAAYVHDHHVRAIVRVEAAADVGDPVGTLDPTTFPGPPLPPGGPYGPLWTGPLFDPSVIDRLAVPPDAAVPKLAMRWVERFREEAAIDAPFYYEPNEIARRLHHTSPVPPDRLVAAIRAGGFPAARTHVRDGALRTPAPWTAVESIVRAIPGAG